MAQWLGSLIDVLEDLGSIPRPSGIQSCQGKTKTTTKNKKETNRRECWLTNGITVTI